MKLLGSQIPFSFHLPNALLHREKEGRRGLVEVEGKGGLVEGSGGDDEERGVDEMMRRGEERDSIPFSAFLSLYNSRRISRGVDVSRGVEE